MGGFMNDWRRLIAPTDAEIEQDNERSLQMDALAPDEGPSPGAYAWDKVNQGLDSYSNFVRNELPGPDPESPIGRFGDRLDLSFAGGVPMLAAAAAPYVKSLFEAPIGNFSDVQSGSSRQETIAPRDPRFADVQSGGTRMPVQAASTQPLAASPVQGPPSAFKAVRLPDGRILYTNVEGYEGHEVDPAEAAQSARMAAVRADPGSRTMQALVNNARRAGQSVSELGAVAQDQERMRTGGAEPITIQGLRTGGTLSFPAAGHGAFSKLSTPQSDYEEMAGEAERAIGMENLGSRYEIAQMSPQEQAALGNQDIQTAEHMTNAFGPKIEKALAVGEAQKAMISDPKHPRYIKDEGERRKMERRIDQATAAKVQAQEAIMSVVMRQRVPSYQ